MTPRVLQTLSPTNSVGCPMSRGRGCNLRFWWCFVNSLRSEMSLPSTTTCQTAQAHLLLLTICHTFQSIKLFSFILYYFFITVYSAIMWCNSTHTESYILVLCFVIYYSPYHYHHIFILFDVCLYIITWIIYWSSTWFKQIWC